VINRDADSLGPLRCRPERARVARRGL